MKVTIVGGGGGVGGSAAFNLLLAPEPFDVVLVDVARAMATSHARDLEGLVALRAPGSVRVGDAGDVLDADVVVVAASVPLTANATRIGYLDANMAVLRDALGALADAGAAWPGVLLVVTNPVDPLVTWLQGWTGIPRQRVLGYTLNDSLRLRTALGAALGVPAGDVDAWVLGEHGDLAVPLFGRVTVRGTPVAMGEPERETARRFVSTWYARHVALDSGRSSTWTSGAGIARMVVALLTGTPRPLPASIVLAGEYGIDGVALGVPVSLGPGGVETVHEWPLTAAEAAGMRAAAKAVREAISPRSGGARRPARGRRGR
jgi:malate dehydrogenase